MTTDIIEQATMGLIPMSLKTFSLRYGIREEFLQWGIVRLSYPNNPQRSADEIPVVLLKDLPLFIDIQKDTIRAFVNSGDFRYEKIPCTLEDGVRYGEDKDGEKFAISAYLLKAKSGDLSAVIDKGWAEQFYSTRILSDYTRSYRLGSGQSDYRDPF